MRTVVEYARAFKSRVHIITVVPDFGMSLVGSFFPKGFEQGALAEADKQLHAYAQEKFPDEITRRHIVGHGVIYKEILHYAGVVKADLIVMSAHRAGAGGLSSGPQCGAGRAPCRLFGAGGAPGGMRLADGDRPGACPFERLLRERLRPGPLRSRRVNAFANAGLHRPALVLPVSQRYIRRV